ncbi:MULTISPECIES: TetR/AcrR family transcriptional regulator [unclassified Crossiella]|uniref:TetR/AcrR family transcriptional regulator n=1 Tax=unclassified Crossiella TaxID=2620835 RepID=UPI001FFE5C63|nr:MULTISPECIES: TetR/AcrR family transcriptional regulator [unclassified Crossiella]MCK2244056.1 TetR/AcrR family transcriptional regulator [Crossiella sp. S99.2]MCK2257086.1 TetR/AcrR family transcriptional regulator [Crossiella sp. S99.1]
MAEHRMSRPDRRDHLLRTAAEILHTNGANALTLVTLAERAGVSRPVAYDHFGTREGLLLAMYQDYDEHLAQAMRAARSRAGSLAEVVTAVCTAYVDGMIAAGPDCGEVQAALLGHPETRDFREQSERCYLNELRAALKPFAPVAPVVLVGLFSALDGVARAAAAGRVPRGKAVAAAVAIVVGVVQG